MRLFTWPYNPNTSGAFVSHFACANIRFWALSVSRYLSADMFADFCLRTILPFVFPPLFCNNGWSQTATRLHHDLGRSDVCYRFPYC